MFVIFLFEPGGAIVAERGRRGREAVIYGGDIYLGIIDKHIAQLRDVFTGMSVIHSKYALNCKGLSEIS
jgi:hypothetical protein